MRLATNCIENASVNNIVILLQNCGSPEQLRHTHGYIKWSRMSPWGKPAANAPEGVSPEGHFEIRPNNPKEKKSPLNIRLFTRITMSFGGQIVWRDLIDRRNKKKSLSCHVHSPFSPDAFFYLRPPPPPTNTEFSHPIRPFRLPLSSSSPCPSPPTTALPLQREPNASLPSRIQNTRETPACGKLLPCLWSRMHWGHHTRPIACWGHCTLQNNKQPAAGYHQTQRIVRHVGGISVPCELSV